MRSGSSAARRRPLASLQRLAALALLLAVAACGGSDSGSIANIGPVAATPVTPVAPAPSSNFVALVVDHGPAALAVGPKGYVSDNVAFVTITLCIPGTTTCQTIDHVEVDTGSVGLRIPQSVLNASLQGALPLETDASSNPVGECFGYVDGYVFGSVRTADFQIGGEKVAGMPLQVIGDGGQFAAVPPKCSAGGGNNLATVQALGANGVLGIGLSTADCGARCTVAGGFSAAVYYDCPASGCSAIIARAASASAPFEQLPNPVAAMSVDNNGSVVSLPAVPGVGSATLSGTLYFGIGTQTNNTLGSATVLATSSSTSSSGPGILTVVYRAQSLADSFIDSGSNAYYFSDSSIPKCTGTNLAGFYCPTSSVTISPVIQGRNGLSATVIFTVESAKSQFQTNNAAVPGIGGDPAAISSFTAVPNSFDIGLPFFYGRSVYTAIEGRNAGGTVGPYIAF